jgi:uncharacterized membrane protein YkvA (DUF1232 family)
MKDPRKFIRSEEGGIFTGIANHLKLVWRLMQDDRINPFLKLLPLGSIVYLLSPFDFMPLFLDDIGVLWFFTYLFIELSPDYIVEEHKAALGSEVSGKWGQEETPEFTEEDIEDAAYREKDDQN